MAGGRRGRLNDSNLRVKKKLFLEHYAEYGNLTLAANAVEVARTTYYAWCEHDDAFAVASREAREMAADVLEAEVRRRGIEGVEEPVFHKGEICGKVRKYSDTLLIFLLNGTRPEKYRQNVAVTSYGPAVKEIDAATYQAV